MDRKVGVQKIFSLRPNKNTASDSIGRAYNRHQRSKNYLATAHRILWLNFVYFLRELYPFIIVLLLLYSILLLFQFLNESTALES